MYSRKEQIVKNDSDMDDDDEFISIEEHNSSDDISDELSLSEKVFTRLQIYSEGFKPSFFMNKVLSNLSLVSTSLNDVASSELIQRVAQELLSYVLLGEQGKAQAMIEKNPGLLLIKSKAVDYSGRTIIGTAFQAALGAGDKPMWEMMLPYFEGLEQGEALRQFDEQFPNGIEETPASELQAYYNAIILAIINDEDHGLSRIEGFRKEITCQKEITQGKHFNLQHLSAAYQAYIDYFNALGNWDNRDLFWQKVIGYVHRQMTAYDTQIHCSGVYSVLGDETIFERTFELSNGEKLFPLLDDSGLGFDFACFSYYSCHTLPMAGNCCIFRAGSCLNAVDGLCGAKINALAGLESDLRKGCTISPFS